MTINNVFINSNDRKTSIRDQSSVLSPSFLCPECEWVINTYTATGIFIYTSLVCQRSKC